MNDSHAVNPWEDAIASYLLDHRQSCDSAEGIARWWLNAPVTEWPRVRQALQAMVSDGRLERLAGADGRDRYRLPGGPGATPRP